MPEGRWFQCSRGTQDAVHGTGVTEAELLPAAGAGAAFQRKRDDSHGGQQERLGTAADWDQPRARGTLSH